MLSNEHEHKHEPLCFVCIALSTCPRRECRRFSGRALVATRRFGYRRNRLSHCPKFVFAALSTFPCKLMQTFAVAFKKSAQPG
jgi:hypothetical protein